VYQNLFNLFQLVLDFYTKSLYSVFKNVTLNSMEIKQKLVSLQQRKRRTTRSVVKDMVRDIQNQVKILLMNSGHVLYTFAIYDLYVL